MTTEVNLYRWRREAVRLVEALDWLRSGAQLQNAVALLSSPTRFILGKGDATGRIVGSDGEAVDVQRVFEARVFTPVVELRWLRDREGGTAAIVSEEDLPIDGGDSPALAPIRAEPLERSYLLWGASAVGGTLADGWSRLAAARIGTLDIPLGGVGSGQRVQLRAIEYLSEMDRWGNAAVTEERLIELAMHQRLLVTENGRD